MIGALIPDLAKITLLIPGTHVVAAFDMLFSWLGIQIAGGALLTVLIGVVVVPPQEQRRVFWLLSLGTASHLIVDAFLIKVYGHSYPLLWPLTTYAPPTPGLYLSTDVGPVILMGTIAIGALVIDRWCTTKATTE